MASDRLKNVHPGEVLEEEFLKPFKITHYRLAKAIHVSQTRIGELCQGKRALTADTALRLARFFGTSAQFWLGLQEDYELEEASIKKAAQIAEIVPFKEAS